MISSSPQLILVLIISFLSKFTFAQDEDYFSYDPSKKNSYFEISRFDKYELCTITIQKLKAGIGSKSCIENGVESLPESLTGLNVTTEPTDEQIKAIDESFQVIFYVANSIFNISTTNSCNSKGFCKECLLKDGLSCSSVSSCDIKDSKNMNVNLRCASNSCDDQKRTCNPTPPWKCVRKPRLDICTCPAQTFRGTFCHFVPLHSRSRLQSNGVLVEFFRNTGISATQIYSISAILTLITVVYLLF